jgi:Protein of unknown function (DUF1761)
MNPNHINWLAVVAAALSTFVVGGLWYSPMLFGKIWMRVNGFTEDQVKTFNQGRAFAGAFLLALVMSANLAMFLADSKTTLSWGIIAGALAGAGWVAAGCAVIALFENRSWQYVLVNGGYLITAFVLMGAILGAWR